LTAAEVREIKKRTLLTISPHRFATVAFVARLASTQGFLMLLQRYNPGKGKSRERCWVLGFGKNYGLGYHF